MSGQNNQGQQNRSQNQLHVSENRGEVSESSSSVDSDKLRENKSNQAARRAKEQRVRALYQRYVSMLQRGCGDGECKNTNCASNQSRSRENLSYPQMRRRAADLLKQKAPLCKPRQNVIQYTDPTPDLSAQQTPSGVDGPPSLMLPASPLRNNETPETSASVTVESSANASAFVTPETSGAPRTPGGAPKLSSGKSSITPSPLTTSTAKSPAKSPKTISDPKELFQVRRVQLGTSSELSSLFARLSTVELAQKASEQVWAKNVTVGKNEDSLSVANRFQEGSTTIDEVTLEHFVRVGFGSTSGVQNIFLLPTASGNDSYATLLTPEQKLKSFFHKGAKGKTGKSEEEKLESMVDDAPNSPYWAPSLDDPSIDFSTLRHVFTLFMRSKRASKVLMTLIEAICTALVKARRRSGDDSDKKSSPSASTNSPEVDPELAFALAESQKEAKKANEKKQKKHKKKLSVDPRLTKLIPHEPSLKPEDGDEELVTDSWDPWSLRMFLILLHTPELDDCDNYDTCKVLCKALCRVVGMPRRVLVNWFSQYPQSAFEDLLRVIQQYLTVRLYTSKRLSDPAVAVIFMGMLYDANEVKRARFDNNLSEKLPKQREPLEYTQFYNDAVNQELDWDQDFRRWSESRRKKLPARPTPTDLVRIFAFASYNFILDPSSKDKLLHKDADAQMAVHYRHALQMAFYSSRAVIPYLVLKIRRDNLVLDSLARMQSVDSREFKKPLKIVFANESGVDEGGLRKEWFQLIIKELFDPMYGMFIWDKEANVFWFNPDSPATASEYELIGITIGLAIYNSVRLDLKFPPIVYKKLLGREEPTFRDLCESFPDVGKMLQQLLDFDGDVENTYMRTFTADYITVYGELKTVELKKGGKDIPLTNDNREEYVRLYTRWKLVDSVQKQFTPLCDAFQMVCGGDALNLFRHEEVELLVCGSPDLDFKGLEEATRYDNGYSRKSKVIKMFWEVVHTFNLDEKKRFLQFATGTDRAPIEGLSHMNFTICRQGPDSEQLPTSHTCFNQFLLPEYSTKKKLEAKLRLAIANPKGFGLI